jgi:cobalt-zinc-cadmium efflux system membrane fusion protein
MPERPLFEAQVALREARVKVLAQRQALANLGLAVRLEDLRKLPDEQAFRKLRLLGLPPNLAGADQEDDLPASLLPLRAPFAGQVVKRDVVVGEVVTPSLPQFVVADLGKLWVMLDVRLEDVGLLAVGQEVTFRSEATDQEAAGKLTWISPDVDPKTRTVRARAEVANPSGRLRPATFGKA